MEKISVGIIGAGWIAHKMAQALAPLQEAEVIAIASRSQDKADAFAAQYGIPKAYDSYEKLVQDPEVDLVYIATPHSHHYPHAHLALECKRCLEQGLTESPMMPHAETLSIMHQMDALRQEWGVRYPMD